jgi:hypothetical protein
VSEQGAEQRDGFAWSLLEPAGPLLEADKAALSAPARAGLPNSMKSSPATNQAMTRSLVPARNPRCALIGTCQHRLS